MAADSSVNGPESSAEDSAEQPKPRIPRPPRPVRRGGAAASPPSGGINFPPRKPKSDPSDAAPELPPVDVGPTTPLALDLDELHEAPTAASDDVSAAEALRAAALAAVEARQGQRPPDSDPVPSGEAELDEDEYAKTETVNLEDSPASPRYRPDAVEGLDAASPSVGIDEEDERDDTIVGEVSQGLLDLSSGDDETRAYTAPQELIELAKRKREERRQARQRAEALGGAEGADPDSLPSAEENRATAPAPGPSRHPEHGSSASATAERYEAVLEGEPLIAANDSLPRSDLDVGTPTLEPGGPPPADAMTPIDSGVRSAKLRYSSEPPEPPEVLGADPSGPESVSASSERLSRYETPWLSGGKRWALIASAFVILGYLIASWLVT